MTTAKSVITACVPSRRATMIALRLPVAVMLYPLATNKASNAIFDALQAARII
ncbi:hypothetical protein GP5015_2287 [gamma proteobacterium HTCC5015]|nr:hypothetical protein GP5015_2287 [gamma proteobacterium HTCC5015]